MRKQEKDIYTNILKNRPVEINAKNEAPTRGESAYSRGFKAGIKKVVGWIETVSESDGENPTEFSVFPEKEWQSKLKEWGVK